MGEYDVGVNTMPTTICNDPVENVDVEVGTILTIDGTVLRTVQVTAN